MACSDNIGIGVAKLCLRFLNVCLAAQLITYTQGWLYGWIYYSYEYIN